MEDGGRVDGKVSKGVDGSGVLRSGVANSSGVSGDGTRGNVVGGLSSSEETVSRDDGVSGEGRSLWMATVESRVRGSNRPAERTRRLP